ncbi:MAG: methyltransferase domain-containing protein [Cyanobacteria bacterium M_surface_7_m2_040]|nr:methyltransferase domain-containing protein [Cyanobacteria bacterium K_Offshore_0m_m2_072]MBM5808602.1 methyltransferase domain-containing protein [Cyanobacteria bacterium M_surface_9_m1_291]MBM5826546.1 methyltransferase domain-containing protein [Cyanobacteria bacterium M_surface_7_m2_040]
MSRAYTDSSSVAKAYDNWTNDALLERLWGDHIHLGHYGEPPQRRDFRQAKIDFVDALVRWSGLDQLAPGSRLLDVGCGIGGSSRILAARYGFDVLGISISPAQIARAQALTPAELAPRCRFAVMDALNLELPDGSFDAVWSVEACPHMADKQRYADELLRMLRPGGRLAVADWNRRDPAAGAMGRRERWVMRQLLDNWAHPEFASIEGLSRNLQASSQGAAIQIETGDWSKATLPSWIDSILEGVRRPAAVLGLGPRGVILGLREIPTILLMHWAFASGLMRFGVFRGQKPA